MNQAPPNTIALSTPTSLDQGYAEQLLQKQTLWWKRWLDVQAPYRWNLRRLQPGWTLDIGCGVGRNLLHLRPTGVGVDPNVHAVAAARQRGLVAFTPHELRASEYFRPKRFDSLLLAHVCEHLGGDEAPQLLREYLPLLRHGGCVILITPQEAGYASDATHREFYDFARLRSLLENTGLTWLRGYSFPLPRSAGRWFSYNEFVALGQKP